jgi:hypothetical protein
MRIQNRLRRLERRAGADHVLGDTEVVQIRVPYDGRGGDGPGRYPCPGGKGVVIIYEPEPDTPQHESGRDNEPVRCLPSTPVRHA